jgi:hypothetical protein
VLASNLRCVYGLLEASRLVQSLQQNLILLVNLTTSPFPLAGAVDEPGFDDRHSWWDAVRQNPETRNLKLETRNSKSETRNPKPETGYPEPTTLHFPLIPGPETRNLKSRARHSEPKT